MRKVEILARHIGTITGGSASVKCISKSAISNAVLRKLAECDLVFSCTDNLLSRAALNRLAYQYLIPVIDIGVRIDARKASSIAAAGRVTLVGPDLACLRCSGHLDPDRLREELLSPDERAKLELDGYIQGSPANQPAVVSLNSLIASLGVTAFLNLVNQWHQPHIEQIYDEGSGTVFTAGSVHLSGCEICGADGIKGLGDLQPVSTFE